MRADRLEDRTAENVAKANTSVPAAVAKDEIVVVQSTARKAISRQSATALPPMGKGTTEAAGPQRGRQFSQEPDLPRPVDVQPTGPPTMDDYSRPYAAFAGPRSKYSRHALIRPFPISKTPQIGRTTALPLIVM